MQKGFARFAGVILIFFGLIQLLPMVGISVAIGNFDFTKWFPIAYILIGIIELSASENGGGWFWGLFAMIFGLIMIRPLFNVPVLNAFPLETFFAPILVLSYGVKSLTDK